MADVSQIVLKDANGNVIGTYDVKDVSVPHDSKSAASGGTTLSLVTTGEKATWNAKSDTDTTYTFANGTNGFTVTPSGGSAQTVTVTPSIPHVVTGSGTEGCIAKFSTERTILNGPAFGSSSTKYLRNDGNWVSPPNTTYTFTGGTNKFTFTPSGGTATDVTITPSITNNVTGTGTSGYIAKFNGAHTVTNGPAFGSTTNQCLCNDGAWRNFTNNAGTVTQVKVGTTAYNPSSGVVSLPAYPSTLTVPTGVKCTINNGGWCRMATYVIVVDMVITMTANVDNSTQIISGLPKEVRANYTIPAMNFNADNSVVGFRLYNGGLYANSNKSSGTVLHIFGTYLS